MRCINLKTLTHVLIVSCSIIKMREENAMKNGYSKRGISMFLMMASVLSLFMWNLVEKIYADYDYYIEILADYDIAAGFEIPAMSRYNMGDYVINHIIKSSSDYHYPSSTKIVEAYWLDNNGNKVEDGGEFFKADKYYDFVLSLRYDYVETPIKEEPTELTLISNGKVRKVPKYASKAIDGNNYQYIFRFYLPHVAIDNKLEIGSVKAPVVGATYDVEDNRNMYAYFPGFPYAYSSCVDDALLTNYKTSYWCYKKGGKFYTVRKGDKFEEGRVYVYFFEVGANPEYFKFEKDRVKNVRIKVDFDGDSNEKDYYSEDAETFRTNGSYWIGASVEFGEALKPEKSSLPVESFTIEGMPPVLIGSTPMMDETRITGISSSKVGSSESVHVSHVKWYDNDGREMTSNQTFEAGKQYKVGVVVANKGNNYMTLNSKPTIVQNTDYYFFEKMEAWHDALPTVMKAVFTVSPRKPSSSPGQNKIQNILYDNQNQGSKGELIVVNPSKRFTHGLGPVELGVVEEKPDEQQEENLENLNPEKKNEEDKQNAQEPKSDEPSQQGKGSNMSQQQMKFQDVGMNQWFYSSVKYVYDNRIMFGVAEQEFAPKSNVSRAMIVTMLYRIAKEPAVSGSKNYIDNNVKTWYSDAVKWTAQKGLAKEFAQGNFDPNRDLTREEMISIIYNYHKSRGRGTSMVNNLNDFKDGYLVSAYAQPAMRWAVKSGIIFGDDKKKINPQAKITRAEVAAIIQRFNELK